MGAGKARLSHHGKSDPAKAVKKNIDDLNCIIGELTVANDVLKKTLEESRD